MTFCLFLANGKLNFHAYRQKRIANCVFSAQSGIITFCSRNARITFSTSRYTILVYILRKHRHSNVNFPSQCLLPTTFEEKIFVTMFICNFHLTKLCTVKFCNFYSSSFATIFFILTGIVEVGQLLPKRLCHNHLIANTVYEIVTRICYLSV